MLKSIDFSLIYCNIYLNISPACLQLLLAIASESKPHFVSTVAMLMYSTIVHLSLSIFFAVFQIGYTGTPKSGLCGFRFAWQQIETSNIQNIMRIDSPLSSQMSDWNPLVFIPNCPSLSLESI